MSNRFEAVLESDIGLPNCWKVIDNVFLDNGESIDITANAERWLTEVEAKAIAFALNAVNNKHNISEIVDPHNPKLDIVFSIYDCKIIQ